MCSCCMFLSSIMIHSTMHRYVQCNGVDNECQIHNMYCSGNSRCTRVCSTIICSCICVYYHVRSMENIVGATIWSYYDRWICGSIHTWCDAALWICTCTVHHTELYNYILSYGSWLYHDNAWLIYIFVICYLWKCYDAYLCFLHICYSLFSTFIPSQTTN